MKELSFEKMETIEGGKVTAADVFCNLTTNGISAIWGVWGGGIAAALGASAIASGGLSIVIGIVGGAVLSSIIC